VNLIIENHNIKPNIIDNMNNLACPVCGQPSDSKIEGKCKDCFLESIILASIPLVVHTVVCPLCGAFKKSGSWVESNDEIEEIINNTIKKELKILPDSDDVQVSIEFTHTNPSIYQANIKVTGNIKGLKAHAELNSEIRVIKETCDACSRLSGGYYESIIQIRAEGRFPDEDEVEKVLGLVYEVVERQKQKGDRLSFISKEEKLHEGTDVYIGSNGTARQICRLAGERFGCKFSESPTLSGKKNGKDIYRITYSLRLPRLMPGDIINIDGKTVLVRHSGKRTSGLYLDSGLEFADNTDRLKDSKKISSLKDAVPVVLLSIEHETVQVMHPKTFRPVTLKKPAYLSVKGGEEIKAVIIGDDIFILP
jgi:nonsense-mediated mRNA decay protein 3